MPKIWIILLVLTFLSGQLLRFSYFSPDVHFLPLDIFIAVFVSADFLSSPRKFLAVFRSSPLYSPIVGFALIAMLSLLLSFFRYGMTAFFVGSFYWLRWTVYTLSFIPFQKVFSSLDAKKLLIFVGILMAASGIIQYIVRPDIRSLSISEWDPHYYRVVGTLLDPGFLGVIYVFTLIIISFYYVKEKLHPLWILVYLPLAFTYSRSSFLAYAAGMTAVAYIKKSWKYAAFTLLLLLITLPSLPRVSDGEGVKLERTSSISARLQNWKNSLQIISSYPVLGVGFNTYRYAQKQFGFIDQSKWLKSHAGAGADSSLMFVAATTGLLGLAFYLKYIWSLWSFGNSVTRITLISLLVHSFFLNSLFYSFVLVWIAMLAAFSAIEGQKSV